MTNAIYQEQLKLALGLQTSSGKNNQAQVIY